MIDLEIQKYLRLGGTLVRLMSQYGIKARRHSRHPNLVSLKYDMITSPMGERIVQECRGIILDEAADWCVVARAFDKFFNHGEGHAAPIHWPTARFQEKIDGSLITLYWYADGWHVASSGTPDACGDIHKLDASGTWQPMAGGPVLPLPTSFAEYFWQTIGVRAPGLFSVHNPPTQFCYSFELTGPLNRVVVPHAEARVTLIGARHVADGDEISSELAASILGDRVPAVREFPLYGMDDMLATFGTMSPLGQEGYVVVDGRFNRVKVKHPGYVALHHAKDGMSVRAFVEIARTGEVSEVIAAFPELQPMLDDAHGRLAKLVTELEADYAAHRHHETQKDFAIAVKGSRCSAALFALRAGKVATVREFLAGIGIDTAMRLLGYTYTSTS